jgi:protein involved in polysaccharide export with SLBB domain
LHPEYFIDPDIIVNFKKITPNRVLVMGQVGKPDHVKVDRGEGIMDALVEAGYLTRNSVRTQMYVFREDDGETHVYHANYEKYARGNLRQNIPLQNGDLVYVRTHFWPHFDRLQDVLETIGFGAGTADTIRDAQN